MLHIQRIKAAPTLGFLLTRDQPRNTLPEVTPFTQSVAMLVVAAPPATP